MARETEIGTLIREGKSDDAMAKLVRSLRKHRGNVVHASSDIGVHHATFKRWLVALENSGQPIRQVLEEIRGNSQQIQGKKLKKAG